MPQEDSHIARRYYEMGTEEFAAIHRTDFTDEGKRDYDREVARRESPEYREAEKRREKEYEQRITGESNRARWFFDWKRGLLTGVPLALFFLFYSGASHPERRGLPAAHPEFVWLGFAVAVVGYGLRRRQAVSQDVARESEPATATPDQVTLSSTSSAEVSHDPIQRLMDRSQTAWASGTVPFLTEAAITAAKDNSLRIVFGKNRPLLEICDQHHPFAAEEILVGVCESFILTTQRLDIFPQNCPDGPYHHFALADIRACGTHSFWRVSIVLTLSAGETVKFRGLAAYPKQEVLNQLLIRAHETPPYR